MVFLCNRSPNSLQAHGLNGAAIVHSGGIARREHPILAVDNLSIELGEHV